GSFCRNLVLTGDGVGNGQCLVLPEAFVGKEEKCFVLLDGAAETSAEIVALERSLRAGGRKIEKVSRVQIVVPEKLKQFAVVVIGAGTCGQVYDGARISSVLRGEG